MKHIWSQPDWPDFHWDAGGLSALLADVRYKQGRFLGKMSALGFELSQEATLEILTDDVVQSSAIEGEFLNPRSVRRSIAQKLGIDQGGLGLMAPQDRAVEGIVQVVLDATVKAQEPLTDLRLFDWHGALFPTGRSNFREIDVGKWRTNPVHISDGNLDPLKEKIYYTAPPEGRVPDEMARFLDWFNEDASCDPLLKAGLAHYWFVAIHPFDDGNGRIGRAITDMALARSDHESKRYYSISASIKSVGPEYYTVLETTSNGGLDITAWQDFFLKCVSRSIDMAEHSMNKILTKARFWDEHRSHSLSDRQQKVVNRLLDGFDGKMTSQKWAKMTKVSQDTATRDINDLIAKGVLRKSDIGGRAASYNLVLPEAARIAPAGHDALRTAFTSMLSGDPDSRITEILVRTGLISKRMSVECLSDEFVREVAVEKALLQFSIADRSVRLAILEELGLPESVDFELAINDVSSGVTGSVADIKNVVANAQDAVPKPSEEARDAMRNRLGEAQPAPQKRPTPSSGPSL